MFLPVVFLELLLGVERRAAHVALVLVVRHTPHQSTERAVKRRYEYASKHDLVVIGGQSGRNVATTGAPQGLDVALEKEGRSARATRSQQ